MPPPRRRPIPKPGQTPPVRRRHVAGRHHQPEPTDRTDHVDEVDEVDEVDQADQADGAGAASEPDEARAADRSDQSGRTGPADEPTSPVDAEPEHAAEHTDTFSPVTDPATDTDTDTGPDTGADSEPVTPAARRRRETRAGTRPAGKRRSGGTRRPDDLAVAETDTGVASSRTVRIGTGTDATADTDRDLDGDLDGDLDETAVRARLAGRTSAAILLTVLALGLASLAVWFRAEADELSSGAGNAALIDRPATTQAIGQLTTAIEETFSYNYTDLDSTKAAVEANLVGKASCEYDLMFGKLAEEAPKQKIILATVVRKIGLVRLDGDRAEALVFIDQSSTRADVNKTVQVGGQLGVQAQRHGDSWKISKFDMFGQPLFNGEPAPTC